MDSVESLLANLSIHDACPGTLYASVDQSIAERHEGLLSTRIQTGISLEALLERPKTKPLNSFLGRGRGRKVTSAFTRDELLSKRLLDNVSDQLGSLSVQQTTQIVQKFWTHLSEADEIGCKIWAGPASLRLYAPDGSTQATHSPLSVATFLRFGRVLRSNQILRDCNFADCLNPEHLSRDLVLPEVVSEFHVISELMKSIRPAEARQGCLKLSGDLQFMVLRKKGSNGLGQLSISPWKLIYYLAFGKLAADLDRGRVWPACGYFACVNPDHLELEPRSLGPNFRGRLLFYKFAAKFFSKSDIDHENCMPVPDSLIEETAREFGTVSFWRYWVPVQTNDQGGLRPDLPAFIAALSFEKLGWAFYPAYYAGDEPEIYCSFKSDCINPYHVATQILDRSLMPWHRHSFATNFRLYGVPWRGFPS